MKTARKGTPAERLAFRFIGCTVGHEALFKDLCAIPGHTILPVTVCWR